MTTVFISSTSLTSRGHIPIYPPEKGERFGWTVCVVSNVRGVFEINGRMIIINIMMICQWTQSINRSIDLSIYSVIRFVRRNSRPEVKLNSGKSERRRTWLHNRLLRYHLQSCVWSIFTLLSPASNQHRSLSFLFFAVQTRTIIASREHCCSPQNDRNTPSIVIETDSSLLRTGHGRGRHFWTWFYTRRVRFLAVSWKRYEGRHGLNDLSFTVVLKEAFNMIATVDVETAQSTIIVASSSRVNHLTRIFQV